MVWASCAMVRFQQHWDCRDKSNGGPSNPGLATYLKTNLAAHHDQNKMQTIDTIMKLQICKDPMDKFQMIDPRQCQEF